MSIGLAHRLTGMKCIKFSDTVGQKPIESNMKNKSIRSNASCLKGI